MKKKYIVNRGQLVPPAEDVELSLFTCAIQTDIVKSALSELGISVPASFEVTHNSDGDDPPDIEALGLGWECTEFPPNQSAMKKVQKEYFKNRQSGGFMNVPGFSQTNRDIGKMHRAAFPSYVRPQGFDPSGEVDALERDFLTRVLSGPRAKDVSANQILLLDQRGDLWPEAAEEALKRAFSTATPKWLHFAFLVRWASHVGSERKPHVIQLFRKLE
jgi:hypothetical protein